MDRQVDADQLNTCVLQHVYEYKWTVSFDNVRIFPLYQSSIGYKSDCTAVISTEFHQQVLAVNMTSVKITNIKRAKRVQNEPTDDTKGKQQKLLFLMFVKTTSNAIRPASATFEMEVLKNSGRLALMSDLMFTPATKVNQHGISQQVEVNTTRDTSDNTDLVELLRVLIIKSVPLLAVCTVLIDTNFS